MTPKHPPGPPMTLGNMREHGVRKEWIGSFRFFCGCSQWTAVTAPRRVDLEKLAWRMMINLAQLRKRVAAWNDWRKKLCRSPVRHAPTPPSRSAIKF
jgi:hypothetical protein